MYQNLKYYITILAMHHQGASERHWDLRRDHLSLEQPYRAGLKATKTDSRRTSKDPLRIAPERFSFGVSSGRTSPALGLVLQGCSVDR